MLQRGRITAVPAIQFRLAQGQMTDKKPPGKKILPQFPDLFTGDPRTYSMGQSFQPFHPNPVGLLAIVIGAVHQQPVHRIVDVPGKLHRLPGVIALVLPDFPVKVIDGKQVVVKRSRSSRGNHLLGNPFNTGKAAPVFLLLIRIQQEWTFVRSAVVPADVADEPGK